jgi:predicted dehydrogenase
MIKIGVAGIDEISFNHLKAIQSLAGFQISGIYDSLSENTRELCERAGLNYFKDFGELLQNSDVVDIASPHLNHFPLAIDAIKKSKHLFIDSPVVSSPAEALQLINLSEEADVRVQVNYPERFNPAYTATLPCLTRPLYIEAQRHIAFEDQRKEIPIVMDLMMHDIDIILSIVKANIRTVHATGVSVFNGSPDIVNANLEFDNGVVANLTANRIASKNIRRIKFYQHQARVQADFLKHRIKILRKQNDKIDDRFLIKNLKAPKEDKLLMALSSFYQSLIQNKKPLISLDSAYQNLKAAFLIDEKVQMLTP